MDLERIAHLQQLAGLQLTAQEQQQILEDLSAIEVKSSGLLATPTVDVIPPDQYDYTTRLEDPDEKGNADLQPVNLDQHQVEANAPDFTEGFFQVPAVDTTGPLED